MSNLNLNVENFTKSKKNNLFLIIIPLLLLTFIVGFWLGGLNRNKFEEIQQKNNDFSLFFEAWEKIEAHFIYIDEIDRQRMIQGAIEGMIEALDDPHTKFLTPEETELKMRGLRGEIEGIGVRLGIKNNYLIIEAVLENSPATRAELRSGDKIIKIDNRETKNLSIEEAVSLIRGEKGTNVVLSILRQKWQNPQNFTITRDVIRIPPVEWNLIDNKIAYIYIRQFTPNISQDFNKIVNEILNSPADRIILDLRNNPGGSLNEAIKIAGYFLTRDNIILIKKEREKRREIKNKTNGKLVEWPIKVLINQYSASGAEILAAALRDNKDIMLIGETTYGKGSVQIMAPIGDGHSLFITTTEWLTPLGKHISKIGINPCLLIEKTLEDLIKNQDPQLEKAKDKIKM
jgi:carboxyl-terminal processing protease